MSHENVKRKPSGVISLLKEYNGILSLFASLILGIWGINLTTKYGENKDDIRRLDLIAQNQSFTNEELKEFVKLQRFANERLFNLDSFSAQQYSAMRKVLAANDMLIEVQGWQTFSDINDNVASFETSWRAIFSIYESLKKARPNISYNTYRSSMDACDSFFSKEMNNHVLVVEGFKPQWTEAYSTFKAIEPTTAMLDHTFDTIQDAGRKKTFIANREKQIASEFWSLQYYFENLIKLHPERLPITEKYIKYFNKRDRLTK